MKPEKLLPLVLAAQPEALDKWGRLGRAGSLENEVGAAIASGRIVGEPTVGGHTNVFVDPDVVVRVRRARSPMTGRKAWLPVAVARVPRR